MPIDREGFYAKVQREFGANALDARPRQTQPARAGFESILDAWDELYPNERPEWLAYMLATAWHETGTTMLPVRESFASSDEQAVRRLSKRYRYAQRGTNGQAYYGRGYVQLTWDYNYRNLGQRLGCGEDLYNQPDLVMDPVIAAKIVAIGMVEGIFTGKGLGRYLRDGLTDWTNARRIINGTDRADVIAGHARKFYAILQSLPSTQSVPMPAPIPAPPPLEQTPQAPPIPEPPRPNTPLARSRTIWGAIIAFFAGLYAMVRELLRQSFSWLVDFHNRLHDLLGFNPLWIVLGVFILAIVIIIVARIDDRMKKGR